MTSPSSFSVSGLLGGAAGSIDTNALVTQLVAAAALPQTALKSQLALQQTKVSAYQAINANVSSLQTAAQALTDPTAWTATTATSSNPAVVASSTGVATPGATSFNVLALAAAQISTVATDANGNVVSNPAAGISITGADRVVHSLTPASGSASDVAAAINAAGVGVRAMVVNTDSGKVLQLASTTTGLNSAFTIGGTDTAAQTVVSAQNAQIGVGTPGAGGYTVSSSTNSFTGVIPGVTFSVNALATGVGITISSDQKSISDKVAALVSAINATSNTIGQTSSNGAVLQGSSDVRDLAQSLVSTVSAGTAAGGSLSTYGINLDKNGVLSFDAAAFATAYASDPAGTQAALVGSFAANVNSTVATANDPTHGTLTTAIMSGNSNETDLTKRINDWTTKLADIQTRYQAKFTAMETALAKLQSQGTYLTNMFKSMNGSSSSSSN
ncbi:MAG TPA: flagellar filament capping protein FliD [Jatrophihabitans sp.]|uniref:flagellar filament capping protein FliD n=1 Tax=Jatrophihabitans sp. TaxID=1932789 RepID=UPI002E0312AF|nr:flagellar filament capping protein FliD [Jatrophihabitans sp.]